MSFLSRTTFIFSCRVFVSCLHEALLLAMQYGYQNPTKYMVPVYRIIWSSNNRYPTCEEDKYHKPLSCIPIPNMFSWKYYMDFKKDIFTFIVIENRSLFGKHAFYLDKLRCKGLIGWCSHPLISTAQILISRVTSFSMMTWKHFLVTS
jgi:hypothetical protein